MSQPTAQPTEYAFDDDDDDDFAVDPLVDVEVPGVLPPETDNNNNVMARGKTKTPTTSPTHTFPPSQTFRPTHIHVPTSTGVWVEVQDPKSGASYYYQEDTLETTWIRPADFLVPASVAPRPPTETSTVFGGGSENNNNPVDADNNEDIVVVTDNVVEFEEIKAAVIGGVSTLAIVVLVLYGYVKFCKSKRGRSSSHKSTAWQTYDETNLHTDSPRRPSSRKSGLFKDLSPTASPASLATFRDDVSSIGGESYKDDIISMGSPNPPSSSSLVEQYGETRDEVRKATYV